MRKKINILFYCLLCSITHSYSQHAWKIVKSEMIVATPPFAQCHASTIVSLSPRKLLAAWFGGSREGAKDVAIWLATNNNGKWDKPTIIATGRINDTLSYPAWNPVLFKTNSGRLFLFYKLGPSPREWWGMKMFSDNNGKTWSAPQKMEDGILGPIKNKPIQLKTGIIVAGSSTETTDKWTVHLECSQDNGNTWTKTVIDKDSKFDVIQPSILQYADGRLQLLCRSKQGAVVQSWSSDEGRTWSSLSKTTLHNPNAGTDAVTLQNGQQLIVYNPALPGKEWFNGRSKLHVAVSVDGENWEDVLVLENGSTEEFSYPAVVQAQDGKVHITYTYNRKNIRHVVLE